MDDAALPPPRLRCAAEAERGGVTRCPEIAGKETGARGGMSASIQPSSVATSGAIPRDAGMAVGSSAAILSITVSRVSMVVPWRA